MLLKIHTQKYYVIKTNNGEYLGTIRSTKWDYKLPLPLCEEFGVDINKTLKERNLNPSEIWHIGRLAIHNVEENCNNLSLKQRLEILRILLTQAFAPICRGKNNILFAECDTLFLRSTPFLNIKNTEQIGEAKRCIESLTVPILTTSQKLKPFFEQNKQYCYV